mmetsp:Transcript_41574/g.114530  ORF Transcript_41574/g.114530 Transcript_41574/m.114530 type:complete len:314 (-) Transcript_41574:567-1508(-)
MSGVTLRERWHRGPIQCAALEASEHAASAEAFYTLLAAACSAGDLGGRQSRAQRLPITIHGLKHRREGAVLLLLSRLREVFLLLEVPREDQVILLLPLSVRRRLGRRSWHGGGLFGAVLQIKQIRVRRSVVSGVRSLKHGLQLVVEADHAEQHHLVQISLLGPHFLRVPLDEGNEPRLQLSEAREHRLALLIRYWLLALRRILRRLQARQRSAELLYLSGRERRVPWPRVNNVRFWRRNRRGTLRCRAARRTPRRVRGGNSRRRRRLLRRGGGAAAKRSKSRAFLRTGDHQPCLRVARREGVALSPELFVSVE